MSSSPYSHLNQDLAQSVDLFLMRKFEKCLESCKEIIALAKNEPEQERNEEVIEAATALGIQALAESNAWNQTVDFVSEVYGCFEICPPRIIQVSLLLHAHMREYLLCHKLVQIWLQNPSNSTHKMCPQVINVYTQHVLCPTKSLDTLKQILQNCKSISSEVKSSLLEQVKSQIDSNKKSSSLMDRRISLEECGFLPGNFIDQKHDSPDIVSNNPMNSCDDDEDDDENDDDSSKSISFSNENDFYSPVQNAVMSIFQTVCSFMKGRIKILQNRHIQMLLMAVAAVLALIHTQTGDTVSSLGRLVILWRAFLNRIRLFAQAK